MVSKDVPVPLYYQIKEDIIRKIEEGEYRIGQRLPSENEMRKAYNVSLITTRKALMDLVNDGYVFRIQGKGSFVAEPRINRQLNLMSFTEEMKQKGYICDTRVLEISAVVHESIAGILKMSAREKVTKISRLRLVEKEPMALQTSYLPADFLSVSEAGEIAQAKSLYKILASKNIVPHRAREKYSIVKLKDSDICTLLRLPEDSPSFFVRRITYNDKNEPFEYTESFLRWDRYSIEVEVSS
ncbi:MAG: GntR family transcriptional regulator [Ignavibacteriales bacterium]